MVTSDSILAALADFGPQNYTEGLYVRDALKRVPRPYHERDDLFDLLEDLRKSDAAIIVDEDTGKLLHIVTTYDTTQYFRQWSEAMMHARDIELTLKQYLREAFKYDNGEVDESSRQMAIIDITSSNKQLRKKFERALRRYLQGDRVSPTTISETWMAQAFHEFLREANPDVQNVSSFTLIDQETIGERVEIQSLDTVKVFQQRFEKGIKSYLQSQAQVEVNLNEDIVEDAFNELVNRGEHPKPFNELTLNEYVQLLFTDHCWPRCSNLLTSKERMQVMLDSVRNTRNQLAHFRDDEITAQQRQQLKRCANWLDQKKKDVIVAFEITAPPADTSSVSLSANLEDSHN